MAPTHYIGAIVDMDALHSSSKQLSRRTTPSDSIIATVIVVSVLSTLLLASAAFLVSRVWKRTLVMRSASRLPDKPKASGAPSDCMQTDWARKDSNVLWSMDIEEDDLKAQFAVSPKSRLFSVGSVSTVDHGRCPLDRRQSYVNPLAQHNPVDDRGPAVDMRIRTPFEHQTTPTKTLPRARAMSQSSKHRKSDSFEDKAKRKQSLPVTR